jgi:4'-phosphopantetheinyl transferase EntD
VEGWEFDDEVDTRDIANLTGSLEAPAGLVPGSHRWVEWMLGRTAVRQAAARVGVANPVLRISDTGAPVLANSDVGVSITHTSGLALAAAAPCPIGIDVEKVDRDVSRLARSLTPREVEIAGALGVVGSLVAKEAVAKATGRGLGGSLALWPLVHAERSGSTQLVGVATPDGRIVTAQLFPCKAFVVGVALIPCA